MGTILAIPIEYPIVSRESNRFESRRVYLIISPRSYKGFVNADIQFVKKRRCLIYICRNHR